MIENVNSELKKYFEGKPILAALIGFDMIILFVAAGLSLLGDIVNLGGFINGLIPYVLFLGILLCLANNKFQELAIGMGAVALGSLIALIRGFTFSFFSWNAFFSLLIFGFFAYLAFMKSTKKA